VGFEPTFFSRNRSDVRTLRKVGTARWRAVRGAGEGGRSVWSESIIEETVRGLGYELVDVEWAGGGVLRVSIDNPHAVTQTDGTTAGGVTVEDCARVSDQLSRVFLVENVNYERLEISSPGLDRPLKKPADFARFEGQEAVVKLRMSPDGQTRGRKQFQGVLHGVESDAPAGVPPKRFGLVLEGAEGAEELLEFSFDEVERARLVPRLNFKSQVKNQGGSKKR
jgi:ribosome maturation factor RimP